MQSGTNHRASRVKRTSQAQEDWVTNPMKTGAQVEAHLGSFDVRTECPPAEAEPEGSDSPATPSRVVAAASCVPGSVLATEASSLAGASNASGAGAVEPGIPLRKPRPPPLPQATLVERPSRPVESRGVVAMTPGPPIVLPQDAPGPPARRTPLMPEVDSSLTGGSARGLAAPVTQPRSARVSRALASGGPSG